MPDSLRTTDARSTSAAHPDGIAPWGQSELPEPKPLGWKNLAGLIGPGIVMCGIQIGGGEWLFGPDVTAKYGGGLMWIATIAILTQAFYNMEAGRYALYCGEPVFTGFMRTSPGPTFWMGVTLVLSLSFFIPGLSTNAAVLCATLWLDRPPTEADAMLVNTLAYVCLGGVILPVLIGGKVYNTLQFVMTIKVFVVLGFCLFLGVCFVSPKAGSMSSAALCDSETYRHRMHPATTPSRMPSLIFCRMALFRPWHWETSRCWERSPDMRAAAV